MNYDEFLEERIIPVDILGETTLLQLILHCNHVNYNDKVSANVKHITAYCKNANDDGGTFYIGYKGDKYFSCSSIGFHLRTSYKFPLNNFDTLFHANFNENGNTIEFPYPTIDIVNSITNEVWFTLLPVPMSKFNHTLMIAHVMFNYHDKVFGMSNPGFK